MDNGNNLPARNELNSDFMWQLEDIFKTNADWENSFKTVNELVLQIQALRGTLSDSSSSFLNCLLLKDKLHSLMDQVFVYAKMRKDEDNSNSFYQALADRAATLSSVVYSTTSFIEPEILSIQEETVLLFFEENKDLQVYRQYINEILRQKIHILSESEERILAMASEITQSPKTTFSMLNNADIKFPNITDEEGIVVELTKGRYIRFLESKDRTVRENAFRTLYQTYSKQKNTLASLLTGNIKSNFFYSKIRNYSSPIEMYLDSDNVGTQVYDNLIDTVSKHLPLLHRYMKLRKKALNLPDLHMYDLYVPLVSSPKKNIPYDEAVSMVQSGLKILGNTYSDDLKKGFQSGWIDVYENIGKTSGAYSWGAYLTHPYVLLNYQGTLNDVFTIAHEMGHAMHSFYTNKTQPYIYSSYSIFVAEVASTVNEILLMKHLLSQTIVSSEKAYLLNHYLEEFRGTIFRQVMFAEFEKIVHEFAQQGEAITYDLLSKIYFDLNIKYLGPDIVVDKDIEVEWSRIPHFYNSFYVYKYATGFCAASAIAHNIESNKISSVEKYMTFLSSGSSNYPIELLKNTDVDLSTSTPIEDAMQKFAETLDMLESLLK